MSHRRTASRALVDSEDSEPVTAPLLHHVRDASIDSTASSYAAGPMPSRMLGSLPHMPALPRRRAVLVTSFACGLLLWTIFAFGGPDAYVSSTDWRPTWPASAPERPMRPPTPTPVDTRPWAKRWRDRLLLPPPEDEEAEVIDLREDLVRVHEVDEHRYTIIWLHVRRARGSMFGGLAQATPPGLASASVLMADQGAEKYADEDGEWIRTRWAPYFQHTRWLIPQAPYGRYDIALDERTRWYNIHDLAALQDTECFGSPFPCDVDADAPEPEPYTTPEDALNEGADRLRQYEDEPGLIRSAQAVNALIRDEAGSIPRSHVFVFGLSQGGVLSILLGLTSDDPLGGFGSIGGYLPLRRKIRALATARSDTPYFIGHGESDRTISIDVGRGTFFYLRDRLGWSRGLGRSVPEMGHFVGNRVAADALAFIGDLWPDARALAPGGPTPDLDSWRASLDRAGEQGFTVFDDGQA